MVVPLALCTGGPLAAQDLNTLDRHLGHQQWQRVQEHQNRNRQQTTTDAQKQRSAQAERCSPDALPVAERRRMETEYTRRARAQGKAQADAWVREQGRQFREKLVAQGVCPQQQAGTQQAPAKRKTPANEASARAGEGGCRMVTRPIAGFGGAMTMGLVPECD